MADENYFHAGYPAMGQASAEVMQDARVGAFKRATNATHPPRMAPAGMERASARSSGALRRRGSAIISGGIDQSASSLTADASGDRKFHAGPLGCRQSALRAEKHPPKAMSRWSQGSIASMRCAGSPKQGKPRRALQTVKPIPSHDGSAPAHLRFANACGWGRLPPGHGATSNSAPRLRRRHDPEPAPWPQYPERVYPRPGIPP